MSQEPTQIVHALLDAWNARDLSRFIELLTPDVEWYDLSMPDPPARGREAVRAFSAAVLRAFPDFTYTIKPPICVAPDGSRCAVHWHVTATHTAPFTPPGFAPTGRKAGIDGVDLFDFRGGQVCRVLTLFDPFVGAEQLFGLSLRPRPGSIRERLVVGLQRMVAAWLRRHPVRPAT